MPLHDTPDTTEQQKRLLSLFTGGPVVLLVWKPEQGWPLEYVSPNCAAVFGYTDTEMTAPEFRFADCVHPDDRARIGREVEQHMAASEESWEQRYRIVRKDGETCWIYDFTRPQRDDQGRLVAIHGYILDQTAQVRSEQALRESELRWQFALEGAGDGLWDWNALTNKVFFSKRWKTMLGYEEHEIGDTLDEWDSRIHPEDRERCYDDLNRHFRGETEFYQNEHRMCCKDGSYIWILDRGKVIQWGPAGEPLRVIGTHTDISEGKEAEEALRKARERYRTLLEFLPDGVLLLDPKTALPVEFNTAAHEQLGYTREEFAGLVIPDYEAREKPEETGKHIETILRTGRDDFETLHRRKDGSLLHVMVTVKLVKLEEEPMFLTVYRDISAIKEAEQALHKSEQRFREFADTVDVAFWVRDRDTMEYVSPGYEKIWGRSCSSLYEDPYSFVEAVHPDDRQRIEDAILQEFRETGVFNEQYRILLPDGALRWVHVKSFMLPDGNGAQRSTGVAQDITDRKLAEDALRHSEQRFKDVARAAGEYIWETDVDGLYVYLTERASEVLGRSVHELLGRSPFEFMPPEDAAEVMDFFLGKAAARESFAGLEHRCLWPDGAVVWQRVGGLPMFDEQGRLTGYRGVGQDITEEKLAAEALRRHKDELEQRVAERTAELQQTLEQLRRAKDEAESASRMKTDFLMNVSHELLTPLNGVQGMLNLLDDGRLDQEQQSCLEEARGSAARLLRLVDSVLVTTRLDKYTPLPTSVDLGALLRTFDAAFAERARHKGLEFATGMGPDCPPVVMLDHHLVQLVLTRLGDNAVKFTEQGGVSLRFDCCGGADGGRELVLTVSDTGIGIPEEKVAMLKTGLVQGESPLTRRYAGLGLGLETVRKALALLRGRMHVDSAPGRGTTIEIRVPTQFCSLDDIEACMGPE